MKRLFTTVMMVLGGLLSTFAQDKEVPLIQNVGAYEGTTLNGAWNYIVDVQEEGVRLPHEPQPLGILPERQTTEA